MTVELYDASRAYAGAPPGTRMSYRGGMLLSKAEIVGVFFDELDGTPYALKEQVTPFLDAAGSLVFGEESEYDIAGFTLAPGTHTGDFRLSLATAAPTPPPPVADPKAALIACLTNCFSLAGYEVFDLDRDYSPVAEHLARARRKHGGHGKKPAPALSLVLQDADVQRLLSEAIAQESLPKPGENTIYACYFPTGVSIQIGLDGSCTTFCGYHDQFITDSGVVVQYAVFPYPDCAGCLGGLAPVAALQSITSHELAETITDPAPGSGWYDAANGEVGDPCAWQTKTEGDFTVQLLWSNQRNACS